MNREWIYKSIGMALCSALVIFAGAMARSGQPLSAGDKLSPHMNSYLNELGIKHFETEYIFKPQKTIRHTPISCTEQEINEYITIDLENYDSLEDTDREIVQKGDFVRLEFSTDKSWRNAQKTLLKVGKNQFDINIEKALPGKRKGEIYHLKNSQGRQLYVKVECIVNYIRQSLTPDFIKNTLGFASKKDYLAHIRKELLAQKKLEAENKAANLFFNKTLAKSNITLDKQEVTSYCMNYYVKKEQQMAMANNQSFEEYLQEMYQLEKEDYYQKIFTEGEQEIKKMIITGILAQQIQQPEKNDYAAMQKAVVRQYITMDYSYSESPSQE